MSFVVSLIQQRLARIWDQKFTGDASISRSETHNEYAELYKGPIFELEQRFSLVNLWINFKILSIVSVTLFYGYAIPGLYLTAALQFFIQYFIDKYFSYNNFYF